MTKTDWIDIEELKRRLDFSEVLRHYGVELKLKGYQHHGFCPLPNHKGRRNSPSFSANLTDKIWQCFGCGEHGNILDFAVLMEKGDPKNGKEVQRVAKKLADEIKEDYARDHLVGSIEEDVRTNVPLDFELKDLDAKHPYLLTRGLNPETIKRFGLGYCSRGLLRGRIAIPIHDEERRLVGYAGRVVDDSQISEDNPKYRFPGRRERGDVTYEFSKSLLLYNMNRIHSLLDNLVVVEGFASVWWLDQNGIPDVVGLMGWHCSFQQAKLIKSLVNPNGIVWIFSDGDEAGERCAHEVFARIAPDLAVRWIASSQDNQPTSYGEELLRQALPFEKGGDA